jgi:hypothetical protein
LISFGGSSETSVSLQIFAKHVVDYPKHSAQFEMDVKKNKKTVFAAFCDFLNNAPLQAQEQKPKIATKPKTASDSRLMVTSKSDFESPALSSTRVEGNVVVPVVVSEVSFASEFRVEF